MNTPGPRKIGPKKGPGAFAHGEKAKDFKGTVKNLLKSLGGYKKGIIVVFVFAIASTIFSIFGPKILGNATEEIFNGIVAKLNHTGGINFDAVHKVLLTVLSLYVISALCNFLQAFIMSTITQKYTYQMRKKINEKIHKLPFKYYDNKTHGEVLSIVTNDVDTLQMSFNQALTQMITSITTIVGILIMMITIDIPMTFIALLMIPISSILMVTIIKKSQPYFLNNQKYLAEVNGNVEEMYSGHNVIKAFNAEDYFMQQFNENNKKLYEAGWKSQFFGGIMHPIMRFVSNLGYVFVAIIGGYFAMKGRITVGNIQSFISYTKNFTQPIDQIAQVSNQIQTMIAAAERIFEFLNAEEEVYETKEFNSENILGNVEFKNVKFGYDEDKMVIKDFSINVKAGQKVAIVGPTGAGKTTIVKLLMHFYEVNDGSILIDGHDIDDYDITDIRKSFGMVLQDTWLYSGTIMENLRYGKLDATDEEVIEAAKVANVHHFIKTLPDGYNMVIDEEMNNISQGQKQLLTIARAILANSKILILDEATSNVDTRTEELIQSAMDELMKGRTSFIIAHRLSTIKNADIILVMNEGDIVEVGNHEELLEKDGFYAKLYNSQFEI